MPQIQVIDLLGVQTIARKAVGESVAVQDAPNLVNNLPVYVGLQLWLKADAITGLNDTDPVGTWSDQSGNGNDATQVTGSKRPIYKANILNGRPVVRFDSTDDFLDTTTTTVLAQPWTVCCVVSIPAASETAFDSKAGGAAATLWRNVNNYRFEAGSQIDVSGADAAVRIFSCIANGASSVLAVNGAVTSGNAGASSLTAIRLGINRLGSVGSDLGGDLAEVMLYNRAITVGERQLVESYLSAKYGITLS